MLPVEVAGEKIVDPVHVAGVVHVAVTVEVGKAYVPLEAVFHRSGNQTAGKRQFRSPKRTGNDDAALVGRNTASGILIHQNPEADRTGALIARLIVDDNGTGIADVGVGHGPCLNVDGFSQFRETVDRVTAQNSRWLSSVSASSSQCRPAISCAKYKRVDGFRRP